MIRESDIAYIAGLFDGEGSIEFTKRKEKKKNGIYDCRRISMEIAMTDKSVLVWVHEVLGVGTLTKKPRKGLRKNGTKYLMQYRWRCTFRDAYYVCRLLWPHAHTKLPKIQQVIEHYSNEKIMEGNVVDFQHYKMWMNLE
tara:strand:+ start:3980 stop:4399 length:420 start_codon:yes stop_codon:yes gene_type:complete